MTWNKVIEILIAFGIAIAVILVLAAGGHRYRVPPTAVDRVSSLMGGVSGTAYTNEVA
jgi:hypothetical protein